MGALEELASFDFDSVSTPVATDAMDPLVNERVGPQRERSRSETSRGRGANRVFHRGFTDEL